MTQTAESRKSPRIIDYVFMLRKQCAVEEAVIGEKLGLNASEMHCLETIDPSSRLSTGMLSRLMSLSPSRGGRIIEGLIERGLLGRSTDLMDRRCSIVFLTGRGREARRRIELMKQRCERRITGQMGEGEIDRIRQGLKLLVDAMVLEEEYHVRGN